MRRTTILTRVLSALGALSPFGLSHHKPVAPSAPTDHDALALQKAAAKRLRKAEKRANKTMP